jgi:hypothetical protein
MSVNHEIKSQLARLLATEDLVVEHKKVETACFNVHTRVLTLPLWERASSGLYDMLVGHEVGHALFTPDEDWLEEHKIPQQFVNIVEDARVEKLMKRKYAGLAKTFFNGYKELHEDDFFSIADEDVSTMNLADRTNLYFKVGNFIPLDFNVEEKEIIDLIASVETFADALVAAKELYNYCKKEKQEQEQESQEAQGDSQSPSNEIKETSDSSSEQEDGSDNSQPQQTTETGDTPGDQGSQSFTQQEEPEVRTAENLEDKIRELTNNDGRENVYVQIPQVNLDTVIAKNFDVHKEIDACFKFQQDNRPEEKLFENVDQQFKKFKVSAQKES